RQRCLSTARASYRRGHRCCARGGGSVSSEHTFLVAVVVTADGRAAAEHQLHAELAALTGPAKPISEWWSAEDDRRDGSDSESATFVPHGISTAAARRALDEGGATR